MCRHKHGKFRGRLSLSVVHSTRSLIDNLTPPSIPMMPDLDSIDGHRQGRFYRFKVCRSRAQSTGKIVNARPKKRPSQEEGRDCGGEAYDW